MSELPILSFLIDHADKKTVSFHMPGHKGSEIYRKYGYTEFLEKIMDCDITEIIGADNLFQTEGILLRAQQEYAKLYGVKRAYLLINGTSGGLIAAILASVPKGGKIIMARNCHKAIYNALVLAGITPIYAYPEMIDEYGISGEISVTEIQRCLDENPDASAVILPSPNYYGICSDIKAIAGIVHAKGKILIVDQAHGAHLKFFSSAGYPSMPQSAEEQGADIVVNSIHKTLASFTQSALLTYNTERVDHYVLEDKLQMVMSTSPSYLLMASLDINADILKNHLSEAMGEWYDALEYFYNEAAKIDGLSVIRPKNLDFTKINLDMSSRGLTGAELEQLLLEKGIYAELTTGNILMCMTGIGNTKLDMDRTLSALREIAATHPRASVVKKAPAVLDARLELCGIPIEKERIPLLEGAGRVCASSIIPYPPGIPFVCPGERLTEEVIEYVNNLRVAGEKVIGVNAEGEIIVGKL
ncbi:MAG TPA: aminotransferase class I/II-fold pyridoxal phosphate-dependent enzyme [Methanocorpusculum sp.]|nr:aminotransferase class I/II-fold pyridoxal phosphate-dependent enzyme [Methanocorpusculum sp.]